MTVEDKKQTHFLLMESGPTTLDCGGVCHKCCRSTQPSATPVRETSKIANVSGWVGFAQCTPQKGRGILGQLVRLFANDPSPSPNRGGRVGPSIGVPASQTLHEDGQKGIDRCCGVRSTNVEGDGTQGRGLLSVIRRILSQGGCVDGNTRLHPECTKIPAKWV